MKFPLPPQAPLPPLPVPPPLHNYMAPAPVPRAQPALFVDLLGGDVESLYELLDDPTLSEEARSVMSQLQRGADHRTLNTEDSAVLDGMVRRVAEGSIDRAPAPVVRDAPVHPLGGLVGNPATSLQGRVPAPEEEGGRSKLPE